jgi:hypothetical protein
MALVTCFTETAKMRRKFMIDGRKNLLRIIKCASEELSEDELCEMYSGEYAVSKYAVTTPHLHRRLREINRRKGTRRQIKPFNFVLVGQPEEASDTGEPIRPITKFTKRPDEAPFQPFIDYNTGERYAGSSQLYWKPLPSMMREYLDHPESKFQNGAHTGKMKRRHLTVQKAHIQYIGKEADQRERATRTIFANDVERSSLPHSGARTQNCSFHESSHSVAMIINERREDRGVGLGDDRDPWSLRQSSQGG